VSNGYFTFPFPCHRCRRRRRRCCPSLSQFQSKDSSKNQARIRQESGKNQARIKQEQARIKQESSKNQASKNQARLGDGLLLLFLSVRLFVCLFVCLFVFVKTTSWREATSLNKR
jgi:hypothetical protein